ncbi:hypothetical protein [Borrelia hermsii]|uniref:hypothetical protein n=1 Tax=Borrelia hermsii TaxID=140 RepID=UPI00046CC434|nr:hypothetical protein [Borrelia hermsii]
MFTQVIVRMLMYVQFYALGVFLLGAKLESFCEGEYFCYRRYSEEFNFGSIKSISFLESDMTKSYREEIKTRAYSEEYIKSVEEGYPAYYLEFRVVDGSRAINFKKVIFDGVEAEVSVFNLSDPSVQLAGIKDFQMGDFDVNIGFLRHTFSVPVHNTFTISLRKRFIDRLKVRDRLKITLTSHYGKEFVLETDNFLKKYGF